MSKKVCVISIVIICICLFLTGCTVNLNLNHNSNTLLNDNKINAEVSDNPFNYADACGEFENAIDYSYIDLGNKYFYIIYRNDEEGNSIWSYETEFTEEIGCSTYMQTYEDKIVYIIDNGKLVAIDYENGNVLWKVEDSYFFNVQYGLRDDGKVDLITGGEYRTYLCIDTDGNVIKKINLEEYQELELGYTWFVVFDYDSIILSKESEENFIVKTRITLDLKDYSVKKEDYNYEEVNKELLMGKVLKCDYGESYFFNDDGTVVIYQEGNFARYSVIRYNGNWNIENGNLVIIVNEAIVAYDGEYDVDEDGNRILVNYNEKSYTIDERREQRIVYCPNYDGQVIVILDGGQYELVEPVG